MLMFIYTKLLIQAGEFFDIPDPTTWYPIDSPYKYHNYSIRKNDNWIMIECRVRNTKPVYTIIASYSYKTKEFIVSVEKPTKGFFICKNDLKEVYLMFRHLYRKFKIKEMTDNENRAVTIK